MTPQLKVGYFRASPHAWECKSHGSDGSAWRARPHHRKRVLGMLLVQCEVPSSMENNIVAIANNTASQIAAGSPAKKARTDEAGDPAASEHLAVQHEGAAQPASPGTSDGSGIEQLLAAEEDEGASVTLFQRHSVLHLCVCCARPSRPLLRFIAPSLG